MSQIDLRPHLLNPSALPKATTLFREGGLRMVLLHLKAGDRIPEHQAPGPISVHCLQGEPSFSVSGDEFLLSPGLVITVPAAAPHALSAPKDSLLLVTMAEPAPPSA